MSGMWLTLSSWPCRRSESDCEVSWERLNEKYMELDGKRGQFVHT